MTKLQSKTDHFRLKIESIYERTVQAAERLLPADERARVAVQKWLAVCGYIGIYILLFRFLWLCVQPMVWLEINGMISTDSVPVWMQLEDVNNLMRYLFLMLLCALILYIASPIGQRDYPPRAMFLTLPYNRKQLPVRLLMYAGETLCLILAQQLVKLLVTGVGNIGVSWRDMLDSFSADQKELLRTGIITTLRVFPKVLICDLILRETQVIFYRRKVALLDAAENDPV